MIIEMTTNCKNNLLQGADKIMLVECLNRKRNLKFLNCSEIIFESIREEYNLDISENSKSLMTALGGGLGIGSVCGACIACLACIGCFDFATDNEEKRIYLIHKWRFKFIMRIEEKLGRFNCYDLQQKYGEKDGGCKYIINSIAETFQEIVESQKKDLEEMQWKK